MSGQPTITLYTAVSPNGHKISITLEELGLPYEVRHIDLPKLEHKEPWFLKINPNGRIPALTDVLSDGTPISLFESGNIMQYLVDRYDIEHKVSYPRGTKEYYQMNSWLLFQCAGVGPIQGQLHWFRVYADKSQNVEYATARFSNEAKRLYKTINKHLEDVGTDFLVGNKCTIADIAISTWARAMPMGALDIATWPHLEQWQARVQSRSAVIKGTDIPSKVLDAKAVMEDKETLKKYTALNAGWATRVEKE
ncbi:glutathione S-transferase [Exophiala aquamarina CBS 119918]|uniref:Glutathione S-transferase n=1 Tax=Exophiala aquamarina CBS 119918 TaxID=1182545 RepID=A0A072PHY2_9EURO|nr:glutathione S-transferase [Exophiala aquamarina CBS 119918]KEF58918.1 glutathione S-transferase [Exophiala aquamarina CBS 119918]